MTTAQAVLLDGVSFGWPRAHRACLSIAHFSVAERESVFLHGPSGSGKSTLLSLIGGVVTPQQGSVSILGTDLALLSASARDRFRADHVGIIFQHFNLLPYLSALENIVLPCRFSTARRSRIHAAGRTPVAEARRLSERLELDGELLARRAADLSVGQQQRVAAARALIGRPRIVIADEPTSALDCALQRAFVDLLRSECAEADANLLFVSHDTRLADHCDRVVALATLNAPRDVPGGA